MSKIEIKIVVVEDDISQQESYRSALAEFNIECEKYIINSKFLANDTDLPQILYHDRVDAIIIDLDWGSGRQDAEGSALVDHIIKYCRIPIFVVSGNLGLLSSSLEESPIFKKYDRGSIIFDDLYNEIVDLYSTGYTNVMGNHGTLDSNLVRVFWEHMSSSINVWKDYDEDIKTQRMLRFATTRLNEILNITTDKELDIYNSHEFYIKPPIKSSPFTGDIIDFCSEKYLILTASCDIAQGKSDFVVLAKLDFEDFNSLVTTLKSGEKPSNTATSKLRSYVNNNIPRYHLLPPCTHFTGALVDFQQIKSVPKDDLYEYSSIVSSVNPAFVKDIQSRFSHYYGRQGQPQLSYDEILKDLIN